MANRGRAPGFKMPEEHRLKIANSNVLKRLISFAEGKEGVEMSPHQVTAALGLMKKVLPDLGTVDATLNTGPEGLKMVIEWAKPHSAS